MARGLRRTRALAITVLTFFDGFLVGAELSGDVLQSLLQLLLLLHHLLVLGLAALLLICSPRERMVRIDTC